MRSDSGRRLERSLPTLDIRHLGVRYATKTGTVDALSDVNLTMRDGDFVVALGASGCGKTTLLSCIAGFLPPTEGDDPARRQAGHRPRRRPRRRVPEARADAVAQRRRQRRVRPAHARRRRRPSAGAVALEKLRLVGLEEFADARRSTSSPAACSSASASRARSPAIPKLLLMDEPLGALDAFTREAIQELILDVWHAHRQDVLLHHAQRRGGAVPRHRS